MALRLIYESGANNETTDITEHLPLYTWESTELAEEGSVGTSEITLEDPDGELDIVAWRRVWAYEDTATGSNSLIYYGWITDKRIERGPFKTGTARVWRVSMVDQNAVLNFRVFRGSGGSRPEETDVHRIEWMMDFVDSFGRAPIVEDEFVFGAGARDMDAVDYKGQYTIDLINDCAQHTGKNFYVYTKDNGYPSSQPTRGLWYGSDLHTAYASPLRLSNDLGDIDSVLTFAISEDTSLERRADRVYSGVYIQADNNIAVYEQRASTYNQFTQRDITVPAPNVKTVARATTRAIRNLDDLDTEEDRISTAVYLPAAKVNFIKPGMRLQFKALHLPGYSDFSWTRVLSRTVTEVSEADDSGTPHYYVSLVLSSYPGASSSTCEVTGYTMAGVYGTTFTATATGFYPHNSTAGNFGDYVNGIDNRVFYLSSGGGLPRDRPWIVTDPSTGRAGGWHFRDYGAAKAGMPLGTADGGASVGNPNKLQIMVIGSGTLTIYATSVAASSYKLYRVALDADFPDDPDTATVIASGSMSYPSTVIDVPSDGTCFHYVIVDDDDGAAGSSLYYGGHDWVADV